MEPPRIAVIGAGAAGASCAASLLSAGFDVVVFDKSRGVGGRMATRRAHWTDTEGRTRSAEFDHGAPHFDVSRPRFRAVVDRAAARGCVAPWRERVYAAFPAARIRHRVVPVPNMPAFCGHLLDGVPLRLGHAVTRLHRMPDGWQLILADGGSAGRFDQVVVALPPVQAALLLAGHHDDWANALAAVRMAPCWTLMAVTDDVDWPWDAAEPERGPLARVARSDRKPGRRSGDDTAPASTGWVAHATAAWSADHAEDDPASVRDALCAALERLLPGSQPRRWHHAGVHRWRYATLAQAAAGGFECWWNAALGLGVCGDSFGDGTVEAAWCSGDELADTVAAALDIEHEAGMALGQPVPVPVH
jgi:predicted NAD/FAD-dependent oxidoreductase